MCVDDSPLVSCMVYCAVLQAAGDDLPAVLNAYSSWWMCLLGFQPAKAQLLCR